MTQLRVAVVQAGSTPVDHTSAVDELLDLFEKAAGPEVDVVVFPELVTTPYFCGTTDDAYKEWAQTVPGPDTALFAAAAKRLGTGVIFGLYESAESGLYNSAVVIDAEGRIVSGTALDGSTTSTYRKTSIPKNRVDNVSGKGVDEKHFFEPGAGTVIFEAFGTRIAILICYDRSFPEYWLAARAAGAEVVCVLVSSLGWREDLFTKELQVRALETQVWIVAPNRGGEETLAGVATSYFGRSCIVAPDGRLVHEASPHVSPEIFTETLDLDAVPAQRQAFPLQRDRVPSIFHYLAEAADRDSAGVLT